MKDNFDYTQEKDKFVGIITYSEYKPSISNAQIPLNEVNDNAFEEAFISNFQITEEEEINVEDNNLIINYKREGNILNNCIEKKQRTDISFPKKEDDIKDNCKLIKPRLGRKKKHSKEEGTHTKYNDDNKIIRIKRLMLQSVLAFLNEKIKLEYKQHETLKDLELIKIGPEQIKNANVLFNKEFIHKSLKEILSSDTTKKNHCDSEHNKKSIEKLLNEKNDIFGKILNLEFLEVLDYLLGKRPELVQLKGITFSRKFFNVEDEKYIKSIVEMMYNLENILNKKKPKNKKKIEKKSLL